MSSGAGTGSPRGQEGAGLAPAASTRVSSAQPGLDAMNGEPLRRTVTLTNPLGLHMRPMSAFVQQALKFQSQVVVIGPDGQRVDGKSMFGLMGLAAEQGTVLTVEACGPDQEAAVETLAQFLANLHEEEVQN